MQKKFFLILACLTVGQGLAQAIPAQITYQGTLKYKNVPAFGTKKMHFAITNVDGTIQYGNAIDAMVPVTGGLFSVPLTFTGVDWQNITPYIQVTVEDTVLGPPEAITATVYATLASTVVDRSITRQKIEPGSFQAPGDGLVPQGAIMMFNAAVCPTGWKVFSELTDRVPIGSGNLYPEGTTGGETLHAHSISVDGAHTHNLAAINDSASNSDPSAKWVLAGSPTGWTPNFVGETTDSQGNHNHGGSTGPASSLPPYKALAFCQKQ